MDLCRIPDLNLLEQAGNLDRKSSAIVLEKGADNLRAEVFTEASAYLFQATNKRTYFRQIDIIVPKSWTTISHNSTTASVDTSSEYFLVDEPQSTFNHTPYTRGNWECGKPSWYTHLTPGFLKSSNNAYGEPGRVIVHEWGHLHWGLFDEYPSILNKQIKIKRIYKHFYQKNEQYQGVRCSKHVQGVAIKDKIISPAACNLNLISIDPECKFVPYINQTTRASIMSHQWIPSISGFCDRDNENDASVPDDFRHNSDAENLQNRLCDGKSCWEVLREHEDFKNGNNPPNSSINDTSPVFNVVRKSGKVRVLALDVSGSMDDPSSLGTAKILEQAKAADFVIDNVIEIGTYLSIVRFNSAGYTSVGLTEIVNQQSKATIKNYVPRSAGGGTQIYNGLNKAMEVLLTSGEIPTDGAEIILLSDGMSNDPYLHILPHILGHGIKVHTIAITNSADPDMVTLASQTGGKSFTYLQTTQISFADVLAQSIKSNNDAGGISSQQVFSNIFQVSTGNSQVVASFKIDDGLGNDTSVAIVLPTSQKVNMEVVGPDGTVFNVTRSGDTVSLPISSDAQMLTGEYNFTINLPSGFIGTAEVHVSSSPVSLDAEVIEVSGRLSQTTIIFGGDPIIVYVSVEKGKTPIMNANATLVLAADSSFTPVVLILLDKGAGADPIAEDGVYSVYLMYTYFSVNSNYNIKIYVSGDGTAYYYRNDGSTSRAAPVSGTDESDTTIRTIDAFDRTMVMEEITVHNFHTTVTDTIAPAKITDLEYQIVSMDTLSTPNTMTYEFVWTAPGADLDVGQATSYEIRYGTNRSNLRYNFTTQQNVPTTSPKPKISGSTESLNISFSPNHCNGTCYAAIIATDENGLSGKVSNIVTLDVSFTYIMTNDVTSSTESTTSLTSAISNVFSEVSTSNIDNSTTNPLPNVYVDEKSSKTSNVVIIVVPVITVLALILTAIIIFVWCKYYKGNDEVMEIYEGQFDEEDPEPHPPPSSPRDRHPWGHLNSAGRMVVDVYPFFSYSGKEPWVMPRATSSGDIVINDIDV